MSPRNETLTLDVTVYRAALASMRNLIAEHIAESLERADDGEHRRTMRLVRGLDEAGMNIDNLVEGWLESHEVSPFEVWQAPSARRHPATAPDYNPWAAAEAPSPVVLPESVRRGLVDQIAEMRVDEKETEPRLWALRIASALACSGIDLYRAIDERAQELKPGTPSLRDEPPF